MSTCREGIADAARHAPTARTAHRANDRRPSPAAQIQAANATGHRRHRPDADPGPHHHQRRPAHHPARLRMTPQELGWVVNAYALGYGGFLLLGGRLADRLGRRRVFLAGVAIFTLASLLGGLAPASGLLIAARGLQGLGAALAGPAGLSILTATFADGPNR